MSGRRGKIRQEDGVPFTKGDTRINRVGRPKKLLDLDALLIDVLGELVNKTVAMKAVLLALHKEAISGDVQAAEVLLDRGYGKLKQSTGLEIDFKKLTEIRIDQIISRLLQ
jgi:hypothetical protein